MREPTISTPPKSFHPQRVMVLGATGTIGQATVRALVHRGHDVICLLRPGSNPNVQTSGPIVNLPKEAELRFGDVTDLRSLKDDGFRGERFDTLVSCLASRTGAPKDAWAIDHEAHVHALSAARDASVTHMVLLSAICVQKPLLAFQHAKLAFERTLIDSGLTYSIVRPTALFKSLSGQVERVKRGKPFMIFGDGTITACKPISDGDLGDYLAGCLEDRHRHNRVLPIGGPGDAITPRQQGEYLFRLLGQEPRFTRVPVQTLDAIIWALGMLGLVSKRCAEKAEFARIGRYYATESMLVLDPATGHYDAASTPSTGTETLFDFYDRLLAGEATVELGDHAAF